MRRLRLAIVLGLTACTGASPPPLSQNIATATIPTTTAVQIETTTAAVVVTTSTSPTTTTTTVVVPSCRPDPFSGLASRLAADYPGQLITAHVHDLATGCDYSLNPGNRQRTASVFKIMVMAGTLLEAQRAARDLTDWEMAQLVPMITQSTNPQVRNLWRSFGGSPWFEMMRQEFGLDETTVTADGGSAWGLTTTSARDQVQLVRQMLIGEWGPIGSKYRKIAIDLMTSVIPEQTWGITAGVPEGWSVAQKNGFAGITINSVGWADEPGPEPGYVVAILSQGWPNHPAGIAAVERVNEAVAAIMTVSLPKRAR